MPWTTSALLLYYNQDYLDQAGVDLIIAGALSGEDQVGFAVMNRMVKSAGYNIIKV